ncbi:MAG: ribosomal-processing cysteine protease Prp [Clostridiales bacterium]|nr:ribosomal-processing cysteine protease Prp [Clostridiales bacterium]
MIRIRLKGSKDHIEGFLVWGHARYAPQGADIVCAGVSAVATAAVMGLARRFPGSVNYRILPQGLIYCRLDGSFPETGAAEAQAMLYAMALGLEAIRKSHRKHIDLAYRR